MSVSLAAPRSRRRFIRDRYPEAFELISLSEAIEHVLAEEGSPREMPDCESFPCGECGELIGAFIRCCFYEKQNGLRTVCHPRCMVGKEPIEVSPENALEIIRRQARNLPR